MINTFPKKLLTLAVTSALSTISISALAQSAPDDKKALYTFVDLYVKKPDEKNKRKRM